jgi:hypothetical protein
MTQETPDMPSIAELRRRYERACHAMQTGVAMKMNYHEQEAAPKHLRTGINSAMVETSVLTQFLLEKGIITEQEFWAKMCSQMETEVAMYKQWLDDHLDGSITLL